MRPRCSLEAEVRPRCSLEAEVRPRCGLEAEVRPRCGRDANVRPKCGREAEVWLRGRRVAAAATWRLHVKHRPLRVACVEADLAARGQRLRLPLLDPIPGRAPTLFTARGVERRCSQLPSGSYPLHLLTARGVERRCSQLPSGSYPLHLPAPRRRLAARVEVGCAYGRERFTVRGVKRRCSQR